MNAAKVYDQREVSEFRPRCTTSTRFHSALGSRLFVHPPRMFFHPSALQSLRYNDTKSLGLLSRMCLIRIIHIAWICWFEAFKLLLFYLSLLSLFWVKIKDLLRISRCSLSLYINLDVWNVGYFYDGLNQSRMFDIRREEKLWHDSKQVSVCRYKLIQWLPFCHKIRKRMQQPVVLKIKRKKKEGNLNIARQ